jgi:hypothetical protein
LADLIALSEIHGEIASHVILFHGLRGDPHDTWRLTNQSKVCWPYWLAEDIQGLAVWTVGYEAAVSRWRGSAMHLTDRAANVLERILAEPKLETGEIILLGHSLGGLIIKQLLRTADSMVPHRHEAANFVKRVRRVAFVATPHSGAPLATWGDRLRIFIRPSIATACLVRNDPNLRELNLWYREWSAVHSIEHLILTESNPIRFCGLIVAPDSSDPGLSSRPIPIDATHVTICKPPNRNSEIYVYVRNFITRQLEHSDVGIEETLTAQSTKLEALLDATREGNVQLRQLLSSQGEKTADIVADRLKTDLSQIASSLRRYPKELVDSEIEKLVSIMRRARFFKGFSVSEHSIRLGERILSGDLEGGSDGVKSSALAWCARFIAIGDNSGKSDEFLSRAKKLATIPEITLAEVFRISANGGLDQALSQLSGIRSPTARSVAFRIVTHHENAEAAIGWLSKSGFTHTDLDGDGKFFLLTNLLELCRWDAALECVNGLEAQDYDCTPALLHTAAMVHLLQAIPDELKSLVLGQIPFEALNFPLASTESALNSRRNAQELFERCGLAARELNCIEVASNAEDYALWLELRDSESHIAGLQKLEASMRDSAHSLRRLPLALQFGLKLDLGAVEQEIERQTTLSGGNSPDAAIARFAFAFTRKTPKAVAEYIDSHLPQLEKHLERKAINILEIEMLARAGLSNRAEERLQDLIKDGISEGEKNRLLRIIGESTGIDHVEARKAQFESSRQLIDLVNLVSELQKQNDWAQLCRYGFLLFERTGALRDAEGLARALSETNRYDELAALLRKYPELLDQSDNLQMLWTWSLYREGLLVESMLALEKLRTKRDHTSDRALTVNLAVASGAWEAILPYLEKEWESRDRREADELIQTALLAQVVESPRAKDLVHSAAAKATDNAHILATAYTIATSGGWENDTTVAQWLQKAAELSDDSGPLQKVSLKDLLERAPQWNRQTTDAWQHLHRGALPIFGVARLLNRTLVDMFLLPALANPSERDLRKHMLVPAYSGNRHSSACKYRVIAIDATALLTLGSLGLLQIVCNSFDTVFIPHCTLRWLFEEKQKVTFHQPSRINDASTLRALIATGALKTLATSTRIDPDLAAEVGEELAALIAEALASESGEDRQRLVVRSSPVHRVGSLMEEEADLSRYSSHLCSCAAIIHKLKQHGQLTATDERRARAYLSLHEKDWPNQPEIADGAMLYLDDLSVSYLQHTGLLEKLRPAGLDGYVSTSQLEEINALLRYNQLTSEVVGVIETIRKFLAAGIQTGKVKLSPIAGFVEAEKAALQDHPTFAIVHLGKYVEAIIVDDRFLNEHGTIDDGSTRTPIFTTLDIIDTLYSSGNITFEQMCDYRTKLRQAGYAFVPVTTAELEHYLSVAEINNGRLVESAELKAIRENLLLIRMTSFLQIPKEAFWLSNLMQTFAHALKAQWHRGMDEVTARVHSDWLIELMDLRKWAPSLDNEVASHMAQQGYGAQLMLALSVPLNIPPEIEDKYWVWVDERVLNSIKQENPESYSWIIKRTKELIESLVEAEPWKK